MREVSLINGGAALVDDADFDRVSRYRWRLRPKNGVTAHIDGKPVYMHRLIMDAPQGLEVDHVNRDVADNRRANLRLCTRAQNARNRSVSKKSPLPKGVQPKPRGYVSTLMVDGIAVSAGLFPSPLTAAVAYDLLAVKHHQNFARLNFSPERDWILPDPICATAYGKPVKALVGMSIDDHPGTWSPERRRQAAECLHTRPDPMTARERAEREAASGEMG